MLTSLALNWMPHPALSKPTARPPRVLPYWYWADEPWTGDERPYRKIKAEIDAAYYHKKLTDAVVEGYKAVAQRHLDDPLAQFRWGYAAYFFAFTKPTPQAQDRVLRPVLGTLDNALLPPMPARTPAREETYEYSRLQFLVHNWSASDYHLKSLGERLLRRDPKDWEVKHAFIRLLQPGLHPEEKQLALKYIHELQQQDPKRAIPVIYTLTGIIYYECWCKTGQRADSDAAIAYYRKYLQVAPPNDPNRKNVESWIKVIQYYQAKLDAKKGQSHK